MGKEGMRVIVLTDKGKKILLKMKKKDLVDIIQDVVTIHRLESEILKSLFKSFGFDHKKLIKELENYAEAKK